MKYAVLMIACALPLAACNKPQVNEKNASVADVANAVSKSGDRRRELHSRRPVAGEGHARRMSDARHARRRPRPR